MLGKLGLALTWLCYRGRGWKLGDTRKMTKRSAETLANKQTNKAASMDHRIQMRWTSAPRLARLFIQQCLLSCN